LYLWKCQLSTSDCEPALLQNQVEVSECIGLRHTPAAPVLQDGCLQPAAKLFLISVLLDEKERLSSSLTDFVHSRRNRNTSSRRIGQQSVKKGGGQPLFLIQQNTIEDNLRQLSSHLAVPGAAGVCRSPIHSLLNLVLEKAGSHVRRRQLAFQRDNCSGQPRSAEAQRDLAQLNLSYTDVRAPFDGRMGPSIEGSRQSRRLGENTVLAQINQIDPMYVYFNIATLTCPS